MKNLIKLNKKETAIVTGGGAKGFLKFTAFGAGVSGGVLGSTASVVSIVGSGVLGLGVAKATLLAGIVTGVLPIFGFFAAAGAIVGAASYGVHKVSSRLRSGSRSNNINRLD